MTGSDGSGGPRLVDMLIHGGTVVTMDSERRVIDDGAVAIDAGKIVAVGQGDEIRAPTGARRPSLPAGGRSCRAYMTFIPTPGSSSSKARRSAFPGRPGVTSWTSSRITPRPSGGTWKPCSSAIQRLKCGTTQALYMLGNAPRGDTLDIPLANAKGVSEVGVRSILAFGPSRPPWPREYTYWRNGRRIERLVTMEETFEATDEAIGHWNSAHVDGRVKMWVAVSRILNENFADQVYEPENEPLIRPQAEGIRRIMDKHDVGFHAHGMGTTAEYCYDAEFGLLGPKTVFGHGWPFNARTVEILAETDTRVAHCPRARRVYFFKGRLPIPELIEAGVLVGLGSDACGMDRPYDSIWDDMFFAARWQRLELNDPEPDPVWKAPGDGDDRWRQDRRHG